MPNPFDQFDQHNQPNVIIPATPDAAAPYRGPKSAAELEATRLSNEKSRLEIENLRRQANGGDVADTPGDTSLTGDAYLKTLPKSLAGQVKALSDGRRAFPTGTALKSKEIQTLIAAATQYDPTLDAANAATRVQTRKDFTSGMSARNITSLNTALGHLGSLWKDAQALHNHGIPLVNTVGNAVLSATGDPRVVKFNTSRQAVVDELERVFRGSNGTEAGIEEWKKSINSSQSPDQLRAAIGKGVELLSSRLDALNTQYTQGMGHSADPMIFLNPHAQAVFNALAPGGDGKIPDAPKGGDGIPPIFNPNGSADYSALATGGEDMSMTATDPNANYRTVGDPAAGAFINDAVRSGRPYSAFLHDFRQQFPGYTLPSPTDYRDAIKYHQDHKDFQGSFGAATKSVPLSATEQRDNSFAQSAPGALMGHYFNSAAAGIPAALAGDEGQFAMANMSQAQPGLSLAGDIGGAVTGSFLGNKALKAAGMFGNAGKGLVGQEARDAITRAAIKRGIVSDLGYGATFGATSNPQNPGLGALEGAAAMGAGNVAGRYVLGPGLAAAGTTRFGKALAPALNFNPASALGKGEGMVFGQANKAGLPDVLGRLDDAARLNVPYALADADPRLRTLTGSATRKSPNVLAQAEETFAPRQFGQAERAISAVDTHLAPSGDMGQIQADALARARAASQPLYEKAMAHPAPEMAANPQLAEILRRPSAEAGLRRAYNIALDEGANPAEISISMGADGKPVLLGSPTWKTLQYVRRGLDSEIDSAIDPMTGKVKPGMSDAQGAMIGLRKDLDGQIGKLNPDFKAADAAFAAHAKQGSAAQMGYGATSAKVTPETVGGVVNNLPPQQLPFYRQGFASSLTDKAENARYSSNPFDLLHGSPAQRAKIASVFPEGSADFARVHGLEGDMGKTYRETLGGSPTASRIEADKLFDGGSMVDAAEIGASTLTGVPPVRAFARMGRDALQLGVGKAARRRAEAVAPFLMNTNPAESAAFLRSLAEQDAARQAYMLQARRAGGMFAAPASVGLIPSQ